MEDLGTQAALSIADLANHPGFGHLLDHLETLKADLLEKLDNAKTPEEERQIVSEWRGFKRAIEEIRGTAEHFKEALASSLGNLEKNPEYIPWTEEQVKAVYTPEEIEKNGGWQALI